MTHAASPAPLIERSPWIAFALSLLSTGVGHIYLGHTARGLTLFCAWLLLLPLALLGAWLGPSTLALVLFVLAPAAAMAAVWLFAALDALRLAGRTQRHAESHDTQAPRILAMLVLVGMIYPLGVLAGMRALVFEAFVVPTSSMTPTLQPGDRVLASKIDARGRLPDRGDVIVFVNRGAGGTHFVKRVVGLPGDTVEVGDRLISINGQPLDAAAPGSARKIGDAHAPRAKEPTAPTAVPDHHVYVLGDNRSRSRDSRDFGCVHIADIVGRVDYITFPAGSWARFGVLGR